LKNGSNTFSRRRHRNSGAVVNHLDCDSVRFLLAECNDHATAVLDGVFLDVGHGPRQRALPAGGRRCRASPRSRVPRRTWAWRSNTRLRITGKASLTAAPGISRRCGSCTGTRMSATRRRAGARNWIYRWS
jgi:hypothetical protein